MKSKLLSWPQQASLLLLLIMAACNKVDETDRNTMNDTEPISDRYTLPIYSTQCIHAPDYGDSIVFLQPVSGDYTIQPFNNKGISGKYLSWPEGLTIDSSTGSINVSQSEAGMRYTIGFVKNGTGDTCVSKLILGGITYVDSIYVLENNDTLAMPVYNANPAAVPVCDASDDTDYPDGSNNGNNKCRFDDDSTGQQANAQKLRVRTVSGIINLKRSINDGLFGSAPRNGESKIIQIRYQLNDGSKMAKQKVSVKVMFYDKVSSIPVSLKTEVENKRNNLLGYRILNGSKPRPPLLIIAGLAR